MALFPRRSTPPIRNGPARQYEIILKTSPALQTGRTLGVIGEPAVAALHPVLKNTDVEIRKEAAEARGEISK